MHQADTEMLVQSLARTLPAELVETHISWVLLTADLAYKIKKPVKLPFVDYSTLLARKHFCEEEVRLNRRLAPSLYLGVSSISSTNGKAGNTAQWGIDAPGTAVEYAVRMRRFAAGALFSEQIAAGTLQAPSVDQLAALLAAFHGTAAHAAADSPFALPMHRQLGALAALNGAAAGATAPQVQALKSWIHAQATDLGKLWQQRKTEGWVRECHGDLHLSNLVLHEGSVMAFDCVEFDPALRWIDVLDDAAFAMMDFSAHGRRDLAFRFVNAWLDATGDHGCLPALRFSAVYRALVRAQVSLLQPAGPDNILATRYMQTALDWTQRAVPQLFITCGLPGSGKTWRSQNLLESVGAIRIRSDVERKRLFGLAMADDSRALGLDLYTAQTSQRTYDSLFTKAREALQAGFVVVLDATFLRKAERTRAQALALELDAAFAIVVCEAPLAVLKVRLQARRGDASEADIAVLERLQPVAEPLTPDELALVHTGTFTNRPITPCPPATDPAPI